jgi:hypothetical protein
MYPNNSTPHGDTLGVAPYPDDTALVALACELGWDGDASWVWITSQGPITRQTATVGVNIVWRTHDVRRGLVRWVFPPLYLHTADFDGWEGYRFELAGCAVTQEPPSPDIPFWRLPYFGGPDVPADHPGSLRVALWRQRAYYQDMPLFAELQWRPGETQPRPYVGGWAAVPTGVDLRSAITRARRGVELLRQLDRTSPTGRPSDTQIYRTGETEQWRTRVRGAIRALLTDNPEARVSFRSLAAWIGMDRETISSTCGRLHVDLHAETAHVQEEMRG